MKRTLAKAKDEMIPCPECGALTYGYMKDDHAFCRSCDCDLTEASKKYLELLKKVKETQLKMEEERKAVEAGENIEIAEGVQI